MGVRPTSSEMSVGIRAIPIQRTAGCDAPGVSAPAENDRFARLRLRFGFMETPNVSKALGRARREGVKFDVMNTSFFLGRRKVVPGARIGLPLILDRLFISLGRFAADPSDYYHLPRDRVVELGSRMTV